MAKYTTYVASSIMSKRGKNCQKSNTRYGVRVFTNFGNKVVVLCPRSVLRGVTSKEPWNERTMTMFYCLFSKYRGQYIVLEGIFQFLTSNIFIWPLKNIFIVTILISNHQSFMQHLHKNSLEQCYIKLELHYDIFLLLPSQFTVCMSNAYTTRWQPTASVVLLYFDVMKV